MKSLGVSVCVLLFCLDCLAQKPSPDAGKTTGNSFQSDFFHFSYQFPKDWTAVPDAIRLEENTKRRDLTDKMAAPHGPNTNTVSRTVITPYDLVIAFKSGAASGAGAPMPRIDVRAQRRSDIYGEAEDPAKYTWLRIGSRIKKSRGPEKLVLSGRKFVRSDFESAESTHSGGEYLSIFAVTIGDYLLEFDLRATTAVELSELVDTMQTLQFSGR